MKKYFYPFAAILIITASAFTVASLPKWKIGDDYTVKFSSKDPSGIFRGLRGDISFDEKDLKSSRFDVTIDVATINTGNGMQNTHAKSDKWFDAEKYPVIKFSSNQITKSGAGYQVSGAMEIHGIKKEITFPFTFQNNTFTGSFEINRNDFSVGDPANAKVPPVIIIDLSIPVSKN